MKKLVLVDKKEMVDENGLHCERNVYRIGNYRVEVDWESGKLDDILIREDFSVEYVPEIRLRGRRSWDGELRFEIQTAAYGAKNVEEIEKVIAGYQEAVKVVNILTEEFL